MKILLFLFLFICISVVAKVDDDRVENIKNQLKKENVSEDSLDRLAKLLINEIDTVVIHSNKNRVVKNEKNKRQTYKVDRANIQISLEGVGRKLCMKQTLEDFRNKCHEISKVFAKEVMKKELEIEGCDEKMNHIGILPTGSTASKNVAIKEVNCKTAGGLKFMSTVYCSTKFQNDTWDCIVNQIEPVNKYDQKLYKNSYGRPPHRNGLLELKYNRVIKSE